MKRRHLITAALLGLGLISGCAGTNACGERQGLFSRWFGQRKQPDCDCVETGRVIDEGPVIPDPGCVTQGIPVTTPVFPTMPPPTPLPVPNVAQPVPAGPTGQTKDVGK